MTTILETKKQEDKHEMQSALAELVKIDQKSPEEAHRSIVFAIEVMRNPYVPMLSCLRRYYRVVYVDFETSWMCEDSADLKATVP